MSLVFCSLQFAWCFVFCSGFVRLFALGTRTDCIGYLGAFVSAQGGRKGEVCPRRCGSQEVQIRSRVRGGGKVGISTALPRMRSDGHRHRRISPPQRTLFGCPASVICGELGGRLSLVRDGPNPHTSPAPPPGGRADLRRHPPTDRPSPEPTPLRGIFISFGCPLDAVISSFLLHDMRTH